MLPFRKRQDEASASAPVDKIERKPDDGAEFDSMEACAEDILQAMEKKDVKMLAAALRSAFEMLDMEPHVEGPHLNNKE